jgi:hypothetical protein
MNAKRWAAHAAVMTTLVAGLTACGGGGDAAPAAKATEEVLTAGLTIKESVGAVPANGLYNLKVDSNFPGQPSGTQTTFAATDALTQTNNSLEAYVRFDSSTNAVIKAVLVNIAGNNIVSAVGCGITAAHACSNITFNPATKEIRASSTLLKELTFLTSTNSDEIINVPTGTGYSGTGSLKASGSVTP